VAIPALEMVFQNSTVNSGVGKRYMTPASGRETSQQRPDI